MRVGVHQRAARQQPAGRLDRGDHSRSASPGLPSGGTWQAGEKRHARQLNVPSAPTVSGTGRPLRLAELEIVRAVPGRDVHEAGAGLGGRQNRPASSGTSKS